VPPLPARQGARLVAFGGELVVGRHGARQAGGAAIYVAEQAPVPRDRLD
jgi:hypothetical protein